MNTSQTRAIEALRCRLESTINPSSRERYGAQISKFEIEPTDYGAIWVRAEIEYLGLGENNVLRALEHQFWFVLVGKRGALYAHSYPRSLRQFKGASWCGINIR